MSVNVPKKTTQATASFNHRRENLNSPLHEVNLRKSEVSLLHSVLRNLLFLSEAKMCDVMKIRTRKECAAAESSV